MRACWNLWKPSTSQPVGKGSEMTNAIASPSVRALARAQGVDINKLATELGRETIAREDIIGSINPSPTTSATLGSTAYWDIDHAQFGSVTEEPMTRFAQLAAGNLAAANVLIPAVTHHDRADMSAVEAFRNSLKPEAAEREVKLTTLAFHVKALSSALVKFPRFNASLSADGKTLILKNYIHIGIAVDTPHGLMVPVIRNANQKGLWQIATEITDLASRAQNRKIKPVEMNGASMSISNLGAIGGNSFTPIINPPEVAILGLTRTEIAPVWDSEKFVPTPMAPLDVSYDHRVINGADAARFLSHYAGLLGEPRRMLI
jgi:pyruvate/2-oxoglutarate dehydrogenase complex dihydrolipoamide acyltransferase (E2) component